MPSCIAAAALLIAFCAHAQSRSSGSESISGTRRWRSGRGQAALWTSSDRPVSPPPGHGPQALSRSHDSGPPPWRLRRQGQQTVGRQQREGAEDSQPLPAPSERKAISGSVDLASRQRRATRPFSLRSVWTHGTERPVPATPRPSQPRTGTGLGEHRPGAGLGKTGLGEQNTGLGEQNTGLGEHNTGLGEQNTGLGEQNTGTGLGEQNTETGLGEQNTGLGEQNTGLGEQNTGLGEQNTGTGLGEQNTGLGEQNTGTGLGEQNTETGHAEAVNSRPLQQTALGQQPSVTPGHHPDHISRVFHDDPGSVPFTPVTPLSPAPPAVLSAHRHAEEWMGDHDRNPNLTSSHGTTPAPQTPQGGSPLAVEKRSARGQWRCSVPDVLVGNEDLPWTCRQRWVWRFLGEYFYPSRLYEAVCEGRTCWYGHFNCTPITHTVQVLQFCGRDCHDQRVPGTFRSRWQWTGVNVAVGCQCVR